MHLRGTSGLFRSGRTFRKMSASPKIVYSPLPDEFKTVKAMMLGGIPSSSGAKCQSCRPKNYTLATYGITINSRGKIFDYRSVSLIISFIL